MSSNKQSRQNSCTALITVWIKPQSCGYFSWRTGEKGRGNKREKQIYTSYNDVSGLTVDLQVFIILQNKQNKTKK